MKKIIFIILFVFLLVGCNNEEKTYENVIDFNVSSPIENHIQYVEDFRLDMIWLDVKFIDHSEQIILDESMMNKKDLNLLSMPGEHNINVTIGDITKQVLIVLYGSNNEKYYCINTGDQTKTVKANNVYELTPPTKSNQYFAGWFVDENLTKPYGGEEVYALYAKYSNTITHRVRFYHENIIIKEEYVMDGKSANPPIMKSYNDYTFSNWDKPFNCITENTDLLAVYKQNHYEVNFYDINNNVVSRQVIEKGKSALAPTLEEVEDKIFVGWSKDFTSITNPTNIYPLYSNKQEFYRVRFYKDSLEEANFMYEEYVKKGETISKVNYEIPNYELIKISESIVDIKRDMDVICTYKVIENSFYVNNKLYTKLPVDAPFPTIVHNGVIGSWKKHSTIKNRYDISTVGNTIILSYDNKTNTIETKDFLENNPMIYVALQTNNYDIYEWYYDKELTRIVDDYADLYALNQTTIYGKKIDSEDAELAFNHVYELVKINGVKGYRVSPPYKGELGLSYIPDTYNGLPVISMDYAYLDFSKHLFIGKNVMEIKIYEYEQASYTNYQIIVHEDNPKYYDINGILYEKGEYKDKLIRYPINHNNWFYDPAPNNLTLENIIITENCLNCIFFDKLYISNGCEFEGFPDFISVQELYISKDIKELVLAPHCQGPSIEKLIIEEGSQLERFESNLMLDIRTPFTLPASVKYLEPRTQTELLMCHYDNMIIPDDHPYFKVVDNMILDQTGTVLIGLYRNKEYDTFIVPDYIEGLFYGCFFDTKINTLVFDYNIDYVTSYNGYDSKMHQHPNEYPFMNRPDYIKTLDILNKPPKPEYEVFYDYYEDGSIMNENRKYPMDASGNYYGETYSYYRNGNLSYRDETYYKKVSNSTWLASFQKFWMYNEDGTLNQFIIKEYTIVDGKVAGGVEKYYIEDEQTLAYQQVINYTYENNLITCTIIDEFNASGIKTMHSEYHLDDLLRNKKTIHIYYQDGVFNYKMVEDYFYDYDKLIKISYTQYDENDNVTSYNEIIC